LRFRKVDIIAVTPLSMNQVENITTKMNIDILCFQYDNATFKQQTEVLKNGKRRIQEALKRGLCIEVCYSDSLKSKNSTTQ
jgi:RNase P/RNase MRP subunit p30